MSSFDDAADEIYAATPAAFVAARTAHVKAAKAAGDKTTATELAALRRPTTAAWLVNLLVREASEQIEALLELGAAMRHAQARLSADALRTLTVQRQQVVRALAAQAHGLAADRGEQVSRDVLHQVQDTLQAALADPDLADQVRQGRLTHPLSYSGFGPAGLTLVRAAESSGATAEPDQPAPADDEAAAEAAARAERERLRAAAKEAVDLAARAVVKAKRVVVTATETLSRADRDLARTEQSVAERQAALDEALTVHERAQGRHRDAAEQLDEATVKRTAAQAELDRCKEALAAFEDDDGD